MFFKKILKKTLEKEESALKETMFEFVKDLCYEIEAMRQIGLRMGICTNDEFAEMMEDTLNEASVFYDDMDPEEILAERKAAAISKAVGSSDNVKVIKVEI